MAPPQMKSLGSYMVPSRGLNFYLVIYREMLKKSSSQEPLDQFHPNFIGNMLGGDSDKKYSFHEPLAIIY